MNYVIRLKSRQYLRDGFVVTGYGVFDYRTGVVERAKQFKTNAEAEAAIVSFKKQLQRIVRTRRAFYKGLGEGNPNSKRQINPDTDKMEFVQVMWDESYRILHRNLPKFRVQKVKAERVTRTVVTAVDF